MAQKMKLNLGCGNQKLNGYINLDISPEVSPDIVWDVRNPLPYDDEGMEEVFCGCMLEQLDSNTEFTSVMNDVWRVLKSGGLFKGYVPSTDPRVMFLDPIDKRFFQKESFEYFDQDKNAWKNFGKQYGFKPWMDVKTEINDNGILHFTMQKP